jgi:hypothetical protein
LEETSKVQDTLVLEILKWQDLGRPRCICDQRRREVKCISTCTVNCLAYNQLYPQIAVWNLQAFPRGLTVAKIKYSLSRNRFKNIYMQQPSLQNLMQLFHCKTGHFSSGDTEDYSHKTWKCLYQLTLWSLAITLRTTRYNIPKLYMVLTLHLCVLYGSQIRQRLLLYTSSTDRFL